MVVTLVGALRELFKDRGYAKVSNNQETGGFFIVGYQGKIYTVQSDFQVNCYVDSYDAIGVGSDYALGAMEALKRVAPAKRIRRSLEVSAKFSAAVCEPFLVRSMGRK